VEEVEYDYTGVGPRGAPRTIDDGARIARYAKTVPDTFAGQWIEDGDSLVVAFTESVDEQLAALRELVYAPDKIRVVQLRYTYRHLLGLQHRIVDILGTKDGLTSWGVDVINNCVVVRVLPERLHEVRRVLGETNPEDVRVELGSPIIAL
jgi:hypothetical protein